MNITVAKILLYTNSKRFISCMVQILIPLHHNSLCIVIMSTMVFIALLFILEQSGSKIGNQRFIYCINNLTKIIFLPQYFLQPYSQVYLPIMLLCSLFIQQFRLEQLRSLSNNSLLKWFQISLPFTLKPSSIQKRYILVSIITAKALYHYNSPITNQQIILYYFQHSINKSMIINMS